ncbi:hypothetical protein U9M48_035688 [Paspalum notatum var. saurae]|uniref:Uncharacterized protein n=1 Tax=Paspalum notatum var. saurae TaxID=547442 RepID=A0AAQ3XA94_PASNO
MSATETHHSTRFTLEETCRNVVGTDVAITFHRIGWLLTPMQIPNADTGNRSKNGHVLSDGSTRSSDGCRTTNPLNTQQGVKASGVEALDIRYRGGARAVAPADGIIVDAFAIVPAALRASGEMGDLPLELPGPCLERVVPLVPVHHRGGPAATATPAGEARGRWARDRLRHEYQRFPVRLREPDAAAAIGPDARGTCVVFFLLRRSQWDGGGVAARQWPCTARHCPNQHRFEHLLAPSTPAWISTDDEEQLDQLREIYIKAFSKVTPLTSQRRVGRPAKEQA